MISVASHEIYFQLLFLSAGYMLLQATEQSPDNCDKERPSHKKYHLTTIKVICRDISHGLKELWRYGSTHS